MTARRGGRPAKPSLHDADAEQVIRYAKETMSEVSVYSAQEIAHQQRRYSAGLGHVGQAPSPTDAAALNEEFHDLIRYHADDFFTVNGLAAFARDLAPKVKKVIDAGSEIEKWPAYFAQIPYAFPDASVIAQKEAYRIGSQAILTKYGKDTAWLERNSSYTLSYRAYANAHEWRLAYRIPPQGKEDAYAGFYAGEIPFCIVVRIDPFTSQVLDIQEQNDINSICGEQAKS